MFDEKNKTSLIIPCPPESFGKFISSLLGKPQILSKDYGGFFAIDIDDILNFHYLITHRIEEQNTASLIQCTVKIRFEDGSNVEIPSIEDFKTYSDIRTLNADGVSLSWVYIVSFKNSEVPEKQQIDVDINKIKNIFQKFSDDRVFFNTKSFDLEKTKSCSGSVSIRISHTSRTWGLDVLNLLDSHINSFLKDDSQSFRGKLRKIKRWIGFAVFTATFVFFLSSGAIIVKNIQKRFFTNYKSISGSQNIDLTTISHKIDYIFNSYSVYNITLISISFLSFFILSAVFSGFATASLLDLTDIKTPSFIVLNERSKKSYEKEIKSEKIKAITFFATVVLDILIGIASTVICAKIWPG